MKTTPNATGWSELARIYPTTGDWPVFVAPDTTRWGGEAGLGMYGRRHGEGIRAVFGLGGEEPWRIAEDDYCFECGNTRDRTGELSIGSDRDDFETIGELDSHVWQDSNPTLIRAERPCDSLLELGWPGILNIGWAPSEVSIILRSWEGRFGAVPLSISDSTLSLVVARPPMTIEDARQVAREHFHFCRYDTQFHGFGGISPYVRNLVGARVWKFWWD